MDAGGLHLNSFLPFQISLDFVVLALTSNFNILSKSDKKKVNKPISMSLSFSIIYAAELFRDMANSNEAIKMY